MLETARLLLRHYTPDDAPQLARHAGRFEIADTTANIPHPYSEADASAWIATRGEAWARREQLALAVTLREQPHELLGTVGLRFDMANHSASLGYWIRVESWGHGYVTEAARALMDFGFHACGLHRIEARYVTRNPASGRVMAKLGMTPEGVLRGAAYKWERFEDLACCAVLRTEWLAANRR